MVLLALLLVYALGLIGSDEDEGDRPNPPPTAGELLVTVLDVGQGNAIAVITPNGHAMLVDAGRSQARIEEDVVPYLESQGVDRLDYAVITHPDQDHVGGMPRVLELMPVESVLDPVIPTTNQTYAETLEIMLDQGIPGIKARRGMQVDLGETVSVEVLWPVDPLLQSGDQPETNDNSIVLRVSYGEATFILPGDLEAGGEAELVELDTDEQLHAQVLVVGHHGSNTSSTAPFLDAVSPEVAIISAGLDNQYGHPHDEVLQRLRLRAVEIYRTDLDGTIEVRTDGASYEVNALGTEASGQ